MPTVKRKRENSPEPTRERPFKRYRLPDDVLDIKDKLIEEQTYREVNEVPMGKWRGPDTLALWLEDFEAMNRFQDCQDRLPRYQPFDRKGTFYCPGCKEHHDWEDDPNAIEPNFCRSFYIERYVVEKTLERTKDQTLAMLLKGEILFAMPFEWAKANLDEYGHREAQWDTMPWNCHFYCPCIQGERDKRLLVWDPSKWSHLTSPNVVYLTREEMCMLEHVYPHFTSISVFCDLSGNIMASQDVCPHCVTTSFDTPAKSVPTTKDVAAVGVRVLYPELPPSLAKIKQLRKRYGNQADEKIRRLPPRQPTEVFILDVHKGQSVYDLKERIRAFLGTKRQIQLKDWDLVLQDDFIFENAPSSSTIFTVTFQAEVDGAMDDLIQRCQQLHIKSSRYSDYAIQKLCETFSNIYLH